MSDSEEENFCYFGKPLEPYDEDAFPKKKPLSVEEQIATDSQGRRRFHGAFTGGFSAGFFNTVGSLEGWTPSEFKSTRQDKAKSILQKAEDFMDEEDLGEYGIAHKTVKATKEYSTVRKRKRQMFPDGPIPGEPVLQTLLSSGNETVGYLLLKNIGIEDKIASQKEESNNLEEKVYGCQMPTEYKIPKRIENKQYRIPKIYEIFLKSPKCNTFGLGYKGLDKNNLNLFQSTSFVMKDKNNKKISVKGQAFGVGAFEEEDDDIYAKEDMTKYDFELTKEQTKKHETDKKNLIFDMFKQVMTPLIFKKPYPPPNIPHSFTGKHKVKKSRFEPIHEEPEPNRKDINPAIRAAYLGENVDKTYTESKSIKNLDPERSKENDKHNQQENLTRQNDISEMLISDRFVSASQKDEISNILKPVQKSETTHGTKELREAARMKMYGPLTRTTTDWHPCSVLCKRFNVPEPFLDRPDEKTKKRTKNLIFEYQKHTEVENTFTPGISTRLKEENSKTPENEITIEESSEKESTSLIKQELEQNDGNNLENTSEVEEDNLPKDITEKVDIAQKLDLFKAVFLSSSESSEDEDDSTKEKKADDNKIEELKANVLSESLIPKIKPIKEGILSNVDFHAFSKPKEVTQETIITEQEQSEKTVFNCTVIKEDISYGPALPSKKIETSNVRKVAISSSEDEDEWVEKGEETKKKSKHKKKHKKEKHRKHKRDKKKLKHEK